MRTYDIPYVPNAAPPAMPEDYKKMTLEQLKAKHLKLCGKCNGEVSVCSKCKTPCEYGKRAIQLLSEEIYNQPPVPLYGGKTLIERAREENAKWHQEHDKKPNEPVTSLKEKKEEEKPKRIQRVGNRIYMEGWWEMSLQAEDQVQWVMDTFNISKTKAKKRIYMHKYNNGLLEKKTEKPTEQPAEKPVETPTDTVVVERPKTTDVVVLTLEAKVNELMQKQSEYKTKMEEYQKLYNEVSEQVDVLCKALDVFNK